MNNQPYKYKILILLRRLSYDDYTLAMKFLPELCNTTPKNFKDWLYRKVDNKLEIPTQASEKIATFFGITVSELMEQPTDRNDLLKSWEEYKSKNQCHV